MKFTFYSAKLKSFFLFFGDGLHITVAVTLWYFTVYCFEVCSNDLAELQLVESVQVFQSLDW